MSSLNKVLLIGRLGSDPDLKYTQSGKAIAKFSLATSKFMGQGQEKTTWHKIAVWEKLAENCAKFLGKGRLVYVEGEIDVQTWTDKTGKQVSTVEILAHSVNFLERAPNQEVSQQQQNHSPAAPHGGARRQSGQQSSDLPPNLEEIPF